KSRWPSRTHGATSSGAPVPPSVSAPRVAPPVRRRVQNTARTMTATSRTISPPSMRISRSSVMGPYCTIGSLLDLVPVGGGGREDWSAPGRLHGPESGHVDQPAQPLPSGQAESPDSAGGGGGSQRPFQDLGHTAPDRIVRGLEVRLQCGPVLEDLVEVVHGLVLLVLEHVEAEAARIVSLGGERVGLDGLQELVPHRRLDPHLHPDREHRHPPPAASKSQTTGGLERVSIRPSSTYSDFGRREGEGVLGRYLKAFCCRDAKLGSVLASSRRAGQHPEKSEETVSVGTAGAFKVRGRLRVSLHPADLLVDALLR